MKTYYVDCLNLQVWLKVSTWLGQEIGDDSQFGFLQHVPYGIWFNGDIGRVEALAKYMLRDLKIRAEIFDGEGNLVTT